RGVLRRYEGGRSLERTAMKSATKEVRPDPRLVPPAVQGVLRTLRSAGKKAYLAGGAVRDLLRIAQGEKLTPPQDFDVATDALRDPFGGVGHLRCGLLRAVGDPLERFREDGLRPMRAVRFASTLRLALDRATERPIPRALDVFAKVASERIREEFSKLLVRGDPPSRGLRLLRRTGLLARIAPELLEGVGFEQNQFHAYDVFRHTLRAVDFAPAELIVR